MTLPWQQSDWSELVALQQSGRLPHALLFSGPRGIGKTRFAECFAQYLLCEDKRDQQPCGRCRSCAQYQSGSHPDVKIICPQGYEPDGFVSFAQADKKKKTEIKKTISVDDIRRINEFVVQTSNYGGHQIVIILPAESMSLAAANSLLKTLEEPPGSAVILLLTESPAVLLPTLRSRCRFVKFRTPSAQQASVWLAKQLGEQRDVAQLLNLSQGAPLTALLGSQTGVIDTVSEVENQLVALLKGNSEPLSVAAMWDRDDVEQVLVFWQVWLLGWIKLRMSNNQVKSFSMVCDQPTGAAEALRSVPLPKLFKVLDVLADVRRMLNTQVNRKLLLEGLLIDWAKINN